MIISLSRLADRLKNLCSVYSSILFINSKLMGLLFLAFTFLHPNTAVLGILSVLMSALLLRFFHVGLNSGTASSTVLNGLLTGLLVGDLYLLDIKVFAFLFFCMVFNLIVTSAVETFFRGHILPVLSVPFSITAICIGLLEPNLRFLADARVYFSMVANFTFLPEVFSLFLKSLGSIFCIPDVAFGFLLWIAILSISPLTSIFLILGYCIGQAAESFFHFNHFKSLRFAEGFNYSLVFTAMAGYFIVPSRFSVIVGAVSVVITAGIVVVGEVILAPSQLQVMAAPFNLMVLGVLLTIRNLSPFSLNVVFFNNPEESVEQSRLLWQRHRYGEVGVFMPVKGRWLIQQGFDGNFTHKGLWQHALDFVAVDANNKLFKNLGFELEDYFTFGREVLAPIQGTVVNCLGTDKDNKIGQVANARNWGNYIIIRSATGAFMVLAHLKKDSIEVKIGDFVQVGQKIAEIGNSGYSKEPHLHLQVQWAPEIGSGTIPFHLFDYSLGERIYFHRTPLTGEIIQSLPHNQILDQILGFKVDETMTFNMTSPGKNELKKVSINTKVDEYSGAFYLFDGISKMNFTKVGSQFYFYGLEGSKWSPLWDLMASAPRIPITYGSTKSFHDSHPVKLSQTRFRRVVGSLLQILKGFHDSAEAVYVINESGMEIRGKCNLQGKESRTLCKLDVTTGIHEFSTGNRNYVREA